MKSKNKEGSKAKSKAIPPTRQNAYFNAFSFEADNDIKDEDVDSVF